MIVITDIKYYTTDSKESMVTKIANSTPFEKCLPFAFYNNGESVPLEVIYETIRGKRFVDNIRSIDVVIGLKNDIAQILSMPFECIENMQKDLDKKNQEIRDFITLLLKIRNLNFFQRLKFLITGRIQHE